MAADLWTHIGYARLAALLAERGGLRFAPNRQPAAEAAMRRVLEELRLDDPLSLARRAAHDAATLDRVLGEVTIGETYFFREPAQLGVVRDTVLPSFRDRRAPARPLRAWSAGCASGEEAYTLAILLRESGWAGASRVLGTDISRTRLAAAERARYTRWSLRGVPEPRVSRYFTRRGDHFHLRPDLRAAVEFRRLNLADDDYAAAGVGEGTMDLVLCRNVLIYLDRATVADVARRLVATLSEDGWLFPGASDPLLGDLAGCETIVTAAGLAYRRARGRRGAGVVVARPLAAPLPVALLLEAPSAESPAAYETPDVVPAPVDGVDAPADAPRDDAAARYARRDYAAAAALASAVVARDPGDAAAWALLVRALANAGHAAEAERLCVAALERHPAWAELAYLHAVLLAHAGRFAASAAAARQALYVDRTLAVAHIALGAALAREGHRTQARRAYRAAERLLAAMPPDALVPLGDGEPAHRLLEAARAQQRRLGEAVA